MAVAAFSLLVAAGVTAGLNWLALLPWKRADPGLLWTERAALLYPARVSAASNVWFVAACVGLAAHILFPCVSPIIALAAGLAGSLIGTYPIDRAVYPKLLLRGWIHIVASRWLLRAIAWAILAVFALAIPHRLSPRAWMLICGFILVDAALRIWLAVPLLRMVRILVPPTQRLSRIVAGVSAKMAVPVRATWIMRGPQGNALAYVFTRELAFTNTLLATQSDEEIAAICAHELGHLTESRWVSAARLMNALGTFVILLAVPVTFEFGPTGLVILAGWTYATYFLLRKVFRKMEGRADSVATGEGDPVVYARALEALYRLNQMPAVMPGKKRTIHPDLYDRMTAAGVPPDYPRPRAPRRRSWTTPLIGVIFILLAIFAHVP